MVRTTIRKDRLGVFNVFITDRPLKNNRLQGNVVKSFETEKEANKFLWKFKKGKTIY